ncbi:MAG TPA: thioesterase domain-containing protein, partial [Longimicrobiaceae bacterium]|nr:thioesterase domain-containing protein [Longimicrobiaceae bacterium]
GEIEAALEREGRVRRGVAVVREDVPGDRRIVAYVVAEGGGLSVAELRSAVKDRLPEYMVPSAFVLLEELPLTGTGKVDRRALPVPGTDLVANAYVTPRDTLELQLAQLWEEVLGVRPVGVRDDFFALGGHSLLAVRLLAQVERLTGTRLPVAALFAGPTVEQMAGALRAGEAPGVSTPLVPIQPAGAARPLFFVHAAGGNVLGYQALSRYLGAEQPFYGLQARGVEGDEVPRARIEEMAADYLAELRAVQPEGPYRLGGWSMGGLVAYEMARQAEASGEAVELLVLVDPSTVEEGEERPLHEAEEPELLASFAEHLGVPLDRITLSAEEILRSEPGRRLHRAWEAAHAAGAVPPDLGYARFERLWEVFRSNVRAARRYRPGPCGADIFVVFSEERRRPAAEAAVWEALGGGRAETVVCPGDHFSMVREPHVRDLAAQVSGALSRCVP